VVITLRTLGAGARRIIGADPRARRGKPAPGSVVRAVVRHDSRGDALAMSADSRERITRDHVELKRCLALLAAAIARAERWYARQETELAAFDRRATGTVDWLRAGGWVEPSLAWSPQSPASLSTSAGRPGPPRGPTLFGVQVGCPGCGGPMR
jgi:hypothetical protein